MPWLQVPRRVEAVKVSFDLMVELQMIQLVMSRIVLRNRYIKAIPVGPFAVATATLT